MNIVPFVLFVIAMTATPGPGNLTMMAIGQATGFRSAVPFLSGTTVGFLLLNSAVGFGLGELMAASSVLSLCMKIIGTAYICYLGIKVLLMTVSAPDVKRRFTFFEGLLVHPTSPKSWAMSVVGFSQFTIPEVASLWQVAIFVSVFFMGQVMFHSMWCWIGASIIKFLHKRSIQIGVNVTVVALMIGATLYAMLF